LEIVRNSAYLTFCRAANLAALFIDEGEAPRQGWAMRLKIVLVALIASGALQGVVKRIEPNPVIPASKSLVHAQGSPFPLSIAWLMQSQQRKIYAIGGNLRFLAVSDILSPCC
jgi:hypothetical protein